MAPSFQIVIDNLFLLAQHAAMRYGILLTLVTACGHARELPFQINADTPEELAQAAPWIAELNAQAGCQWIYGPDEVMPFKNSIDMVFDSKLLRTYETGRQLAGFFDFAGILIMEGSGEEKWPGYRDLVFLHELGHVVGFEHSEDKKSWMYDGLHYGSDPHVSANQMIAALGGGHHLCDRVRNRLAEELQ